MNDPHDEPSAEAPTASKATDLSSGYSAFEGATEDFGIGPGETDPFIGADLGGVTVVRLIGQGGMGRVYEARQVKPSRTVAVKVIRPGVVSESHMRRFDLEAEILARLRHPGIAQIYTVGAYHLPTGEVPFFVMEYIPDAQTLVDYADQKQLSTHERLDLFQKVCDAVAHGHARGVVHRDLKPSNILVDAVGQPKVIDFGVAKSTDVDLALTTMRTDVGQLIGTLQYMSPEQLDGRPDDVDVRSDVYALGVVLYELLSGQPPYDIRRKAVVEAARVVKEEDPTPLSSLNRTLRRDVAVIAGKCLAKEPGGRYSSAAELGADVGRYLAGEPIHASAPGLVDGVLRLARKHRGAAAAISVVAVSLTAGIIGIALFAAKAERERQAAVESATIAKHKRTISDLNRFQLLQERGEKAQAFTLLDDVESRFEPDDIPIEVRVTRSEAEDSIAVFPGYSFAFSPDGSLLAISGVREHHPPNQPRDYAYLIDAVTGERLARLEAPTGTDLVGKPQFSADGNTVAIAATGGTLVHVKSGQNLRFDGGFSPGEVGVTDVFWWDTRNGALLRSFSSVIPHHEEKWADYTDLPFPAVDRSTGRALCFQPNPNLRMTIDTGTSVLTLHPRASWSKRYARSRDGDSVAWLSPEGFLLTVRSLDTADGFSGINAIERAKHLDAEQDGLTSALPIMRRLLAVSDDGALACCESTDGRLVVAAVDGKQPTLQTVIATHGNDVVTAAGFAVSGRVVITITYDGTTRGFDSSSGELLWTSETSCIGCPPPAVSGDGRYFAVHDDTTVTILQAEDGRVHTTLTDPSRSPSSVVFSPTDPIVAVGDTGGRVTIHSLLDGETTRWPEEHESAVVAMAFSPDASMLASCSGSCAVVWRIQAGRTDRLTELAGYGAPVKSIGFNAAGNKVLVSSSSATEGALEVFCVGDGEAAQGSIYETETGSYAANESWFTSSGETVVSVKGGIIRTWPTQSPRNDEFIADVDQPGNDYAMSACANEAITRAVVQHGRVLQLWAIDEPALIGFLETPASVNPTEFVFSPDGTRLVGHWQGPSIAQHYEQGISNGLIDLDAIRKRWALPPEWGSGEQASEALSIFILWDAQTGRELATFHVAGESFSPVFSPDSATFAISGQARSSRTGELLATWSGANDVAYSPDSTVLVVPSDARIPPSGKVNKTWIAPPELEKLAFVSFYRPRLDELGRQQDTSGLDSDSLGFTLDGSRLIFRQGNQLGVGVKNATSKATPLYSVVDTRRGREDIGDRICSPDGLRVAASVGEGYVALWDLEKPVLGKLDLFPDASVRYQVHRRYVDSASPTGSYVVNRFPPTIVERATGQTWPVSELQSALELADGAFTRDRWNEKLHWAWSPDERFLAFAANRRDGNGGVQGILLIYEAVAGQWRGPIMRRCCDEAIDLRSSPSSPRMGLHGCAFAFAPSGQRVYFSDGQSPSIFPSVASFAAEGLASARRVPATCAAISNDMSRVVSRAGGLLTVWDMDRGRPMGSFVYPWGENENLFDGGVIGICEFNTAGTQAVIGDHNQEGMGFGKSWVVHWSSSRPNEATPLAVNGYVSAVAFSPSEERCAVTSTVFSQSSEGFGLGRKNLLTLLDSRDGAILGSWRQAGYPDHVAFVNDGRRFWTWGSYGPAKLWGFSAADLSLLSHRTQADLTSQSPLIDSWLTRDGTDAILVMQTATEAMGNEERRVTRSAFLARSAAIQQSRQRQRFETLRAGLRLIVENISRQAAKDLQERDFGSAPEYVLVLAAERRKRLSAIRGTMSSVDYAEACRIAEQLAEEEFYRDGVDTASIKSLSAEQARAILKQTDRDGLFLPALTELTPSVAGVLAKYDGYLVLDGLTVLSNEAAARLAEHDDSLSLDGLMSLSQEAAQALGRYKGSLSLDGLMSLSQEAAQALGRYKGSLSLDGLMSLSSEVAARLAERKGDLSLDGLKAISKEVAACLVKHDGSLSLDGLMSLSQEAAQALARHKGSLSLDGLMSLSSEVAATLAEHDGSLSLDGLMSLSQEAAQALARHKGSLSLDGLTKLSDEVAVALAQHRGYLSLNGVSEISDAAAQALALHEGGELYLEGIMMVSNEAFVALRGDQKRMTRAESLRRIHLPSRNELHFLPQQVTCPP